jgi:hypothetical protein
MRLFVLCLLLTITTFAFSQKVLRLDTKSTASKMSFFVGQTITFKLDDVKNNDIWFIEPIVDFDIERGIIQFGTWQVHFKDIIAIRNPNSNRFGRTISATLKTFGLGLIVFGAAGSLTKDCPNCKESVILGVALSAVGWILDWIIPTRVYRLGKKNRLRLLDLTIKKEDVKRV